MDKIGCKTTYVSGTETTSTSISCLRKLCRLALSVPEYHLLGMMPSGSPMPGTIYPSSFRFSGVSFKPAVYAMISKPRAWPIRATIGIQFFELLAPEFGRLPCLPMAPYPKMPNRWPTASVVCSKEVPRSHLPSFWRSWKKL
jgi:hypothetical protein